MRRFVENVLKPGDQAFLMSFGDKNQIRLVTDLTGSAEELGRGVEALDRCGRGSRNPFACRSPIWSAVFTAARSKMKNVTGRKALVLLSDGMNTGGPHTLTDAIEAAQDADAPVYAMIFNPFAGRVALAGAVAPVALLESRKAEARMRRLAEETGGRYKRHCRRCLCADRGRLEEPLRGGFFYP
jgi:VWFA-related protein